MILPTVDQDVVDGVFQALSQMEVELDENPLEYGPRRLNFKVAEVRRMLTDTESLYLRVSGFLQKYKAAHRAARASLDLSKKHLMANDPEVRSARNLATQDAIASVKLRVEVDQVSKMESVLEDLDAIMTVVKSKRADLRDLQTRIKDQINLCREEIALGGRWGSKPPPGVEAPDLDKTPKTTLRDLRDILGKALLKEVSSETVETESPEDEVAPSLSDTLKGNGSSDKDLDDFLQAVGAGERKKPKFDIDSILGADFRV